MIYTIQTGPEVGGNHLERVLLILLKFHQNTYDFHCFPYENRCGRCSDYPQINENHKHFDEISVKSSERALNDFRKLLGWVL